MALFTRTTKLDPGAHGARCAWAMAVHHAVGMSRQRNSGYRLSRVNIMAQCLTTPDPSLSPTHLSIRRGRTTTTHYTHHQDGVTQHYTSPFPGVAHWASLWGRPRRWHAKGACATPNKKERCLSVRLSVTCQYSVEIAKHVIKLFSPRGFSHQLVSQCTNGDLHKVPNHTVSSLFLTEA